jgi:hypothetical protein
MLPGELVSMTVKKGNQMIIACRLPRPQVVMVRLPSHRSNTADGVDARRLDHHVVAADAGDTVQNKQVMVGVALP